MLQVSSSNYACLLALVKSSFMHEVQIFVNFANQSSICKYFDHNSYVFI